MSVLFQGSLFAIEVGHFNSANNVMDSSRAFPQAVGIWVLWTRYPPAAEMRPTVDLCTDIQQSTSFVTGPSSPTSQEADRNTQLGQTLYIATLFFTAVQINVKETLRIFYLVIVLTSKPAVQRDPLFYDQISARVCENKWILSRTGP